MLAVVQEADPVAAKIVVSEAVQEVVPEEDYIFKSRDEAETYRFGPIAAVLSSDLLNFLKG
jgi:hypothetical protein